MGRGKKAKDGSTPRRRRRSSRSRMQLFLGLLLFLPAAALVAGGDLDVDTALFRLAGAGVFALLAGVVLTAVTRPAPKRGATPPAPAGEPVGPA